MKRTSEIKPPLDMETEGQEGRLGFKLRCRSHLQIIKIFQILWTMSEMVKYKGSELIKMPKSGPVFYHV
jgi:hypothetical protein